VVVALVVVVVVVVVSEEVFVTTPVEDVLETFQSDQSVQSVQFPVAL
jgi:hypothetical protein